MIRKFRHRGLERLYSRGERSGLNPSFVDKVARILARLDHAMLPRDMDLPGYRLHPLKGKLDGFWSVSVSGNWRIIFRFEKSSVTDVDLVDYH